MADTDPSAKFEKISDSASRRIARFIEPFRVSPGSKVNLAKDFDPAQATPARTLIHKDA